MEMIHKRTKNENLITQPWFYGKIAKEMLSDIFAVHCENGSFLVQDSFTRPGEYTLCISFNGKVQRYPIIRKCKSYTIDDEVHFNSLTRLVEYYNANDDEYLPVKLTQPVSKEDGNNACTFLKILTDGGHVIKRTHLHFVGNPPEIIGKGEFGEVLLATYHDKKVAVKSLKKCNMRSFRSEANLTIHLRHPNIVHVRGVVVDSPHWYLVIEYMAKGSLLQYLQSRGRMQISHQELLKFSSDVCAGMDYMESQHVVHRDLAARNVLISSEMIAKVSDFGLAQNAKTHSSNNKLPVRWSAPEAFQEKKFTNKSDVWSLGIVLWEIYSFGQHPYARMASDDLLRQIISGYRMNPPDGCPNAICDLMKSTWDINPEKRPSFSELNAQLLQLCTVHHIATKEDAKNSIY